MWHDNETELDYVNFESIAKTVGEVIVQSQGQPVSIGVSGAWGVGKSSMIRLIRKDMSSREAAADKFIFVDFNAWLYQGYDDARAALLEVIAKALETATQDDETVRSKVSRFLGRVRWLRLASLGAQAAVMAATGVPVGPAIGAGVRLWGAMTGTSEVGSPNELLEDGKLVAGTGSDLLAPQTKKSPPEAIQELRESFAEALEAMGKTLVVFVDDLDRCLPETAISTLEAMRLFLFIKQTAFIIAADSHVIKLAVKKHFGDTEDSRLVTSYFDKLIQIPIQVPPLGTQEVKAYLALLTAQGLVRDTVKLERFRIAVREQLARSWEGKRVDEEFLASWTTELSPTTIEAIRVNLGLAHMLTTATQIAGNPRLIKRFLNALELRMSLARAQSISIDAKVLTKLLLLERCGGPEAYQQVVMTVTSSDTGTPAFLAAMERSARAGEAEVDLKEGWNMPFLREWLALAPPLAEIDVRKELYVSRESMALVSADDRLSADGAKLLKLLLDNPGEAASLINELKALSKPDIPIVFSRLLDRAGREAKWGAPAILEPLLRCVEVDKTLGSRLGSFLKSRPGNSIEPSIVPKLGNAEWARELFDFWKQQENISPAVKKAISPTLPNMTAVRPSSVKKPGVC